MKSCQRMFSITLAWTSTPGRRGSIGVARISSRPVADVPTRASLPFSRPASTSPLMMSEAETYIRPLLSAMLNRSGLAK